MSQQKIEAFVKALGCMPNQMNIKEMVIFFLGVCDAYDMDFEDIAELLSAIAQHPQDAQPAAHMFADEKLQALFASNPFNS